MPLPSTPPSGPTRAPLLPRFCELEETDDWHECQDQDLPQAGCCSRNISTFSTESTPMTTGRAMVSGSASPVGSGPSQLVTSWDCTSGYRTPDRPRGFIRCFERKEPEQVVKRRQSTSSIDKLSHEALLAPARELRRMSLAPPVDAEKAQKELEETKNLLEKCMSDLADQKMYDQMLEKFRPFLTALSRAEQLLRREQPETLLGFLEPKGRILTFLLELHQQKRQYRRQTHCSLNVLLQCDSWLDVYHREGLLARTPQELLLALPMLQRRRVSKIPEPDLLKVVEAPSPPVISPTRRAAVEADAKVMREKRLRRATRRPEESLEDLLIKSRDQAEALDYAAGGDSDEVQVAFETFHRAVRQAFEKKAAAKGRLSLEGFEPKPQMAAFLVDVGVKRKAWRSRVFYVLTKLLELEAWQEHLQGSEVQWFLDAQVLRAVLQQLLLRVLDKNKRVQEAACSAFATLEETARHLLVPYLEDIVSTLSKAFQYYQAKNLLILYDAVGTLADSVGPELDTPRYKQQLLEPLFQKFNNTPDNDRSIIALFECLSSLAANLGPSFGPLCKPLVERCSRLIMNGAQAAQMWMQNPNEFEKPDREVMAASIDLLSGIVAGLRENVSEVLQQQNFLSVVPEVLKDTALQVKQSAFALVGDSAKHCIQYLAPFLPQLLPQCAKALRENSSATVSNNASWAVGEICIKVGSDFMSKYLDEIVDALVSTLRSAQPSHRQALLMQNVCITLGRLGVVCGQQMGKKFGDFAQVWCIIMKDVRIDGEKMTAFQGFVNMVNANPQVALTYPVEFSGAIASLCPPPPQLHQPLQQILSGYKQTPQWPQTWQKLPQDVQMILSHVYSGLEP